MYHLYHQDHNTGQLVSMSSHYEHIINNIQLNTSGVYYVHMHAMSNNNGNSKWLVLHATWRLMWQYFVSGLLLVWFVLPQEVKIILPEEMYTAKEDGVCFVSGWPHPQNMSIHKNDIKTHSSDWPLHHCNILYFTTHQSLLWENILSVFK